MFILEIIIDFLLTTVVEPMIENWKNDFEAGETSEIIDDHYPGGLEGFYQDLAALWKDLQKLTFNPNLWVLTFVSFLELWSTPLFSFLLASLEVSAMRAMMAFVCQLVLNVARLYALILDISSSSISWGAQPSAPRNLAFRMACDIVNPLLAAAKVKIKAVAPVLQLAQLLLVIPRLYFAIEANGLATDQGAHPEKLLTDHPELLSEFFIAASSAITQFALLLLDLPHLMWDVTLMTGLTRPAIASLALIAGGVAVVLTARISLANIVLNPTTENTLILGFLVVAGGIVIGLLLDELKTETTGSLISDKLKFSLWLFVAVLVVGRGMVGRLKL
jgi:hypothetical protein